MPTPTAPPKNGTWKWLAGILALCAVSSAGWFVGRTGDQIQELTNAQLTHKSIAGHPVMVERLNGVKICIKGIQNDISEIRRDQREILLAVQALTVKVKVP